MIQDPPAVAVADPFVRDLVNQLDAVLLDAQTFLEPLTAAQMNWSPGPGRWSIAQCIEHLTLTVQLYPAEIERMIGEARGRHAAGARPYRDGLIARWVVSGMEPPPRMRVRTRSKVEPAVRLEADRVRSAFHAAHLRFRELLVACDGVPLRHGRMRSPFMPILWFTLRQILQLNPAHARRHLWQARQVAQDPSFPAA